MSFPGGLTVENVDSSTVELTTLFKVSSKPLVVQGSFGVELYRRMGLHLWQGCVNMGLTYPSKE